MENNNLKNAFSVGFTCLESSPEDFKKLANKYSRYINDIYFSPPYGLNFHTRGRINEAIPPKTGVEAEMFACLRSLANEGLKLNLALNTPMLEGSEAVAAIERVSDKLPLHSVTTLTDYVDQLYEHFPGYTYKCSYNEKLKNINDAIKICQNGKFDQVILGSSALRDDKYWQFIDENKVKVIHMLNNGCSFRCATKYCGVNCKNIFYDTLSRPGIDVEKLYAEQSIMPWEFHKHLLNNKYISHFKISSRPSSLEMLSNSLESYINNINEEFIEAGKKYYILWGRLGHFSNHDLDFDYERLCSYKKRLWQGEVENMYKKFGPYEK